MKNENGYRGFIGWLRYVRDYKSNIENESIYEGNIVELQKKVNKLEKKYNQEILNKKLIEQEKDNLLTLREEKIQILSNDLSKTKIDNKTKQNIINILNEQLDDAEETIKNKILIIKELNMKYARCQRKIQKLEKEAQKNEHRINFLKSCKDAPSKEKVLAYEKCMKEVEKRMKNEQSNNNI